MPKSVHSHAGFLNDKHVGPDASSGRASEARQGFSGGCEEKTSRHSAERDEKDQAGPCPAGRVRAPAPTWNAVRII